MTLGNRETWSIAVEDCIPSNRIIMEHLVPEFRMIVEHRVETRLSSVCMRAHLQEDRIDLPLDTRLLGSILLNPS